MAPRWLRVRVDLVAGQGHALSPSPGRVMLVPPTATFDDFGLGVDLAFGRWDITRDRSFRAIPAGRHERRRTTGLAGDLAPQRVLREAVRRGDQFEYLFDDDEKWVHECVVEEFVARQEVQERAPIPVPIVGWGTIPDQYGRTEPPDVAGPAPKGRPSKRATKGTERQGDRPAGPASQPTHTRSRRQRRGAGRPLDLGQVRAAAEEHDVEKMTAAIDGRDLGPALQQVGDALTRVYRVTSGIDQARVRPVMGQVSDLLAQRQWEGDDVLAAEIAALLAGSERRGRTLHVNLEDLAHVMTNGGEDPGGYLHLDTGEVVPAFLHHGFDDLTDSLQDDLAPARGMGDGADEGDNLWIYIDHAADAEWDDMRAFAEATAPDVGGILSVAIRGKGAFARFRRTVEELDLGEDWRVFADDRAWGRARALLRSQGIRPV